MRTRRPTETTFSGPLIRRLLVVLALALSLSVAAAGAALAAPRHVPDQQRSSPAAARVRTAAADEPATRDGSSPLVPLVFAGILILALASPTLPRYYSRYGPYRGERW